MVSTKWANTTAVAALAPSQLFRKHTASATAVTESLTDTLTVTNLVAPSPSRTILCASSMQYSVRMRWNSGKAASETLLRP